MMIPPKSFAVLLFLTLPVDNRLLQQASRGFVFVVFLQSKRQNLLMLAHSAVDLFSHVLFLFVKLLDKKAVLEWLVHDCSMNAKLLCQNDRYHQSRRKYALQQQEIG